MTSTQPAGTFVFHGNTYTTSGIERACLKAVETFVPPNSTFHEDHLDHSLMSSEWKDKQKKPVVTQRDGKYVFIYRPDGLNAEAGFKARLIPKYSLAQAKYQEPVQEEPEPTQYDNGYGRGQYSDRRFERTRPRASGYNSDRPRQYGQGNPANRFGGRGY